MATGPMTGDPLPTLLSKALVAFTVEFDNESEHRIRHRTTDGGRAGGPRGAPWLVSQVMWANVMQYVTDEGVRVKDLHARARTARVSLGGLQRWGYVVVTPDQGGNDLVRPTKAGRTAQEVWRPLAAEVEERWRARVGGQDIDDLRRSLQAVVSQFEVDLPCYLPIVYPTQNGKAEIPARRVPVASGAVSEPDLSVLLSQALLHFTVDFERISRISLPIGANTLRVLDDTGVRVRDLPKLTGVSKEANGMAVGFLVRHGCALIEPDPSASRGKRVRLTPKGQKAQEKYRRVLRSTEEQWEQQFGREDIGTLRTSLGRMVGEGDLTGGRSPLAAGLQPDPGGWRAARRPPDTLPHYPMVLHRGGYPDGS